MKTWDTSGLAPAQRFGYWREVLCEAFTALDSIPHAGRSQGSVVTLHEIADVNAATLSSFAQDVRRGPAEIRRRADEFFFANLQLRGHSQIEQDGRRIKVPPGSFYLVDTTRPYRLDFTDDFHALSFRIPHHRLAPLLKRPRACTAVRVDSDSTLGHLAVSHMQGLMRGMQDLPADAMSALSSTLSHLISVAVRGETLAGDDSRERVRGSLRDAIARFVETHATDAELSVPRVAAHFRVSPRYVHAAFAGRTLSFAQTVLEHRLENAALALNDPRSSITAVALQCGFGDPSYFGRAFRRRYGCTPRDWRSRYAIRHPD